MGPKCKKLLKCTSYLGHESATQGQRSKIIFISDTDITEGVARAGGGGARGGSPSAENVYNCNCVWSHLRHIPVVKSMHDLSERRPE
jgi:hypothetical protein